jgi:Flp pilus assembly pilin Flp
MVAADHARSAGARIMRVRVRRAAREQRGQDVIEYAGMLVLVAAVILALLQLGIAGHVHDAVQSAVNTILGHGGGQTSTTAGATGGSR